MKKSIFNIIIATLLLVACSGGPAMQGYYTFPQEGWSRFNNPVIELEVTNPGIFYDMWLEVHFDSSQLQESFLITTIMYSPSGEIRSRNLSLEFKPDADIDGLMKVKIRKDYAFAEKGICKFEFENRSQRVKSPGILKIGVIAERSQ